MNLDDKMSRSFDLRQKDSATSEDSSETLKVDLDELLESMSGKDKASSEWPMVVVPCLLAVLVIPATLKILFRAIRWSWNWYR